MAKKEKAMTKDKENAFKQLNGAFEQLNNAFYDAMRIAQELRKALDEMDKEEFKRTGTCWDCKHYDREERKVLDYKAMVRRGYSWRSRFHRLLLKNRKERE